LTASNLGFQEYNNKTKIGQKFSSNKWRGQCWLRRLEVGVLYNNLWNSLPALHRWCMLHQ